MTNYSCAGRQLESFDVEECAIDKFYQPIPKDLENDFISSSDSCCLHKPIWSNLSTSFRTKHLIFFLFSIRSINIVGITIKRIIFNIIYLSTTITLTLWIYLLSLDESCKKCFSFQYIYHVLRMLNLHWSAATMACFSSVFSRVIVRFLYFVCAHLTLPRIPLPRDDFNGSPALNYASFGSSSSK